MLVLVLMIGVRGMLLVGVEAEGMGVGTRNDKRCWC